MLRTPAPLIGALYVMQVTVDLKDLILAVPAFVGMFLGIYNFAIELRKRKVRLRVTPKSAKPFGVRSDGTNSMKMSRNSRWKRLAASFGAAAEGTGQN